MTKVIAVYIGIILSTYAITTHAETWQQVQAQGKALVAQAKAMKKKESDSKKLAKTNDQIAKTKQKLHELEAKSSDISHNNYCAGIACTESTDTCCDESVK
jgi:hypothetical protein